jgi:hypothetical protein
MKYRDQLAEMSGKEILAFFKFNEDRKLELYEHTSFIASDNPKSLSERIYCYKEGLTEVPRCACGKLCDFEKMNKGYYKSCGDETCRKLKRTSSISKTMVDRYGKHASKLQSTKDRNKETLLRRYGSEKYVNVEERSKTMKDRYGVEYALQKREFVDKKKRTELTKHGQENYVNPEKKRQTFLKNYGVANPAQNEAVKSKTADTVKANTIEKINNDPRLRKHNKKVIDSVKSHTLSKESIFRITCNNCNSSYSMRNGPFNRLLRFDVDSCRQCNPPKLWFSSKPERAMFEYVRSHNESAANRVRFGNCEFDVYVPDLNVAFEFNGLYWHSEIYCESDYHLSKKSTASLNGFSLVHIYEDEWHGKNEIVLALIDRVVGKSKIVDVKDCVVKEIKTNEAKLFLDANHIDGHTDCSIKYGAYMEKELVYVLCVKLINGVPTIMRHGSKNGYEVKNAFLEIFESFKAKYNPTKVFCVLNFDKFDIDENHVRAGFGVEGMTKPFGWHVLNDKREKHVSLNRKKTYRVFDCGSKILAWHD